MVDVLMPYICTLKSLVLCIKWDSDEKIGQLEQPILFVSGGLLFYLFMATGYYIAMLLCLQATRTSWYHRRT